MNEFELLTQSIKGRFPKAIVSVDGPANIDGIYFMDVSLNGKRFVIRWAPEHPYGLDRVTAETASDYGNAAGELFTSSEELADRIEMLTR